MSDLLKNRLNSHSNAFEGLLSLIPAKYYYDDESSSQWKKVDPEQRKLEQQQTRQAKFDPDAGSSALDEIRKREQSQIEEVIVYDDNGNPVNAQEESIEAILAAKRANPEQNKPSNKAAKGNAKPKTNAEKESKGVPAKSNAKNGKAENAKEPAVDTSNITSAGGTYGASSSSESGAAPASGSSAGTSTGKPGIEDLRKRLAERVNELKAQRKAPGTNEGAFKSREELLAARKRKLELKKKKKQQDSGPDNEPEPLDSKDSESIEPESVEPDLPDTVSFGKIEFDDGSKLSNDISTVESTKRAKKRNAADQLKVLQQRKQKLENLDAEKRAEIEEKRKWSRAILQTEGAKLKDDERLLKKSLKRKENKKLKSEKMWKERMYNQKKGISDRENKRNMNIQAHKEAKKLHLKGKKRKMHMKRAAASLNGKN